MFFLFPFCCFIKYIRVSYVGFGVISSTEGGVLSEFYGVWFLIVLECTSHDELWE